MMNKRAGMSPVLLLVSLFFITSCASTTSTSVWKDDDYRGSIRKVFVIGMARKPRIRRFFEDEFTRQFKSSGINAVSSYEVIPDTFQLNRETVRSEIKGRNIDTVLVTKIVGITTEERYETRIAPAIEENDHFGFIYGTGAKLADDRVLLKTNLYHVQTEKLFWSAYSETYLMENKDRYRETGKFIQEMMKTMKKDGLIK
jgi:hypothetical protein